MTTFKKVVSLQYRNQIINKKSLMNKVWQLILSLPLELITTFIKRMIVNDSKVWGALSDFIHKSSEIPKSEYVYVKDIELVLISGLIFSSKIHSPSEPPKKDYVYYLDIKIAKNQISKK